MFEKLSGRLRHLGYNVFSFETGMDAVRHIAHHVCGTTVGLGGSMTLEQLHLYPALAEQNHVYWHQGVTDKQESMVLRNRAAEAEVYISSVNAIAETGEIINIDGHCNRIASLLYGHKKVYLIIGKNKITEDYTSALFRARNVAAPLNAKRFNVKTPCVIDGRCHDCANPERICCGLSVLWRKPMSGDFDVLLVDEPLGF